MEERRSELRRKSDRDLLKLHGKSLAKKQEKREVRRAIRHSCKAVLTIEFRHQASGSDEWVVKRQEIKGRVLDLSEEGASFFIKYPATSNQTFPFRINIYDGSHIEGQAEVRWVKQKESAKGYTVGVQLTQLDNTNRDKVYSFLAELDSTLGMPEE